jgi:hypothetical protein
VKHAPGVANLYHANLIFGLELVKAWQAVSEYQQKMMLFVVPTKPY